MAIRWCRSSKVFSSSAKLGTGTPASRAPAPLALSEANWIWRMKVAMSGNSRAVDRLGVDLLRRNMRLALANDRTSAVSMWIRVPTEASYIIQVFPI